MWVCFFIFLRLQVYEAVAAFFWQPASYAFVFLFFLVIFCFFLLLQSQLLFIQWSLGFCSNFDTRLFRGFFAIVWYFCSLIFSLFNGRRQLLNSSELGALLFVNHFTFWSRFSFYISHDLRVWPLTYFTHCFKWIDFFKIQSIWIVLGRCLFFKICSHIFMIFEVKLE